MRSRFPAKVLHHLAIQPSAPSTCAHSIFVLPHICEKRDRFFSIPYPLFSIQNSAHPSYFVALAHSLPKTTRGRGGVIARKSPHALTPMESHCFRRIRPNPFRMILFHERPGGGVRPHADNRSRSARDRATENCQQTTDTEPETEALNSQHRHQFAHRR